MVGHPVPHYEESGDDHEGEQSCAEECTGDDEFVFHRQSKFSAFHKVALGIAFEGMSGGLMQRGFMGELGA